MNFIKSAAAAALFAGLLAAAPASAATLQSTAVGQGEKLFTTEMKRDENTLGNQQRGDDIFLRNNTQFTGPSNNYDWGASGSRFDFSLSYDGDVAKLFYRVGRGVNEELTLDVTPDGNWNAFQFFVSARDKSNEIFTTASTTIELTSVNGQAVSESVTATKGVNGGMEEVAFWLGGDTISALSGSLIFDFGTTQRNDSPGSRLALSVKALDIAPVPLPAALPMLLAGLGGLAWVGRRRTRA